MVGPELNAEGLKRQRERLLRGLAWANTFNLVVVFLVAALALLAVWLGYRAQSDAENLWRATAVKAQASRLGGEAGWQSEALKTIAAASKVHPSLELFTTSSDGLQVCGHARSQNIQADGAVMEAGAFVRVINLHRPVAIRVCEIARQRRAGEKKLSVA